MEITEFEEGDKKRKLSTTYAVQNSSTNRHSDV